MEIYVNKIVKIECYSKCCYLIRITDKSKTNIFTFFNDIQRIRKFL